MNDQNKEIMKLRDSTAYIGYEFLTWVFLLLDRDDAEVHIKSLLKKVLVREEVSIILGSRMVTSLPHLREQKTSVQSPLLEQSHEAFASIKNGHLIESLALIINLSSFSVSLNIHASDFAITQAQIKSNYGKDALSEDEKALDEHEQNREEIFLRMAAIDDCEAVINALLESFLSIRLDKLSFERELEAMRKQVNKRLGNYLSTTNMNKEPAAKEIFAQL